eukprot:1158329-Pelagomonas_calceolata.AAC.5
MSTFAEALASCPLARLASCHAIKPRCHFSERGPVSATTVPSTLAVHTKTPLYSIRNTRTHETTCRALAPPTLVNRE